MMYRDTTNGCLICHVPYYTLHMHTQTLIHTLLTITSNQRNLAKGRTAILSPLSAVNLLINCRHWAGKQCTMHSTGGTISWASTCPSNVPIPMRDLNPPHQVLSSSSSSESCSQRALPRRKQHSSIYCQVCWTGCPKVDLTIWCGDDPGTTLPWTIWKSVEW